MAGRAQLAGFSDLELAGIAGVVSIEDVLPPVLPRRGGDMSQQNKLRAKVVTVSKCP